MIRKIIADHLKGFTLIEIIIAMILSGILLAMAVKLILTMQITESLEYKKSEQDKNLLSVYSILRENFINSEDITTRGDDDLIFGFRSKGPAIISFKPSMIIFSDGLLNDSISVDWQQLKISMVDSTKSLVKKLSFNVHLNNLDYPFIMIKDYPGQSLINLE